jgi:hypothetical protein
MKSAKAGDQKLVHAGQLNPEFTGMQDEVDEACRWRKDLYTSTLTRKARLLCVTASWFSPMLTRPHSTTGGSCGI